MMRSRVQRAGGVQRSLLPKSASAHEEGVASQVVFLSSARAARCQPCEHSHTQSQAIHQPTNQRIPLVPVEQSLAPPLHMSTARKFAEEQERTRQAKREQAEKTRAENEEKARAVAVLTLQCAGRRMLARCAAEELRRPRSPQEILAIRRQLHLENRAAARLPGYSVKGLSKKAVQAERDRVMAVREEARQHPEVYSLRLAARITAERAVADRLRLEEVRNAIEANRQQATSGSAKLKLKSRTWSQSHAAVPQHEISVMRASGRSMAGRVKRVSKEMMGTARRFARRSGEALQSMLSA